MVFEKMRHYFATFWCTLDGENPETWYFVGKLAGFGQMNKFSRFLTKSDTILQLFAGNLMSKTLNHGSLLENLLVLAEWMTFHGF